MTDTQPSLPTPPLRQFGPMQQNIGYPQWQQPPYPPPPETYYPPPMTTPPAPRPPRNMFNRTDTRSFLVVLAVVLLVVGGMLIVGFASNHPALTAIPTPTVSSAELTGIAQSNTAIAEETSTAPLNPTQVPDTPTSTSVSNTQIIGVWTVTLNKVYTATSGPYRTANAGEIFVVVDVTSLNTSSSPQLLSSGALFIFQDVTGQAYDEVITGIGKPPDGTVQPGNKLRGQIVYEVSRSLHSFTLQFQDELNTGNSATWNFSV